MSRLPANMEMNALFQYAAGMTSTLCSRELLQIAKNYWQKNGGRKIRKN
jgi:hypothetical protein